jgi:hypothetical protein
VKEWMSVKRLLVSGVTKQDVCCFLDIIPMIATRPFLRTINAVPFFLSCFGLLLGLMICFLCPSAIALNKVAERLLYDMYGAHFLAGGSFLCLSLFKWAECFELRGNGVFSIAIGTTNFFHNAGKLAEQLLYAVSLAHFKARGSFRCFCLLKIGIFNLRNW